MQQQQQQQNVIPVAPNDYSQLLVRPKFIPVGNVLRVVAFTG
jgi:hypothetical protein